MLTSFYWTPRLLLLSVLLLLPALQGCGDSTSSPADTADSATVPQENDSDTANGGLCGAKYCLDGSGPCGCGCDMMCTDCQCIEDLSTDSDTPSATDSAVDSSTDSSTDTASDTEVAQGTDSAADTGPATDTASDAATDSDSASDTETGTDTEHHADTETDQLIDTECVKDKDCALYSDCCNCQAASTTAIIGMCDMACIAEACFAAGIEAKDVRCDHGKCVIGLSCTPTPDICELSTTCKTGWMPEVDETISCYTGRCIPAAECPL